MISMAYGTIPIVRATGGLADSVHEKGAGANGFVFRRYRAGEMTAAIKRALKAYANPKSWSKLIAGAFASDFSWDASAARYVELYQKALAKHNPAK
jgi:starch synthase